MESIDRPIDSLELRIRHQRVLEYLEIFTLGDLLALGQDGFQEVLNGPIPIEFSRRRMLAEVSDAFQRLGVGFPKAMPRPPMDWRTAIE